MPKLRVTVKQELYDAIADACGEPFADSYLSGAIHTSNRLMPHTVTAWLRLKANRWAMGVIKQQGIILLEPLPFGHRDRPDTKQRMAAE